MGNFEQELFESDAEFLDMACGSTLEEIETAIKVLKKVAFASGYGKHPDLCKMANMLNRHLRHIIKKEDE